MNILVPEIAVAEKILRTVAIYGFLLAAFRLAGKRQLGQMTAFELIVLLIVSKKNQQEDGQVAVIPRKSTLA